MPLNKIYQLRLIAHMEDQVIENIFSFDHVLGDGISTNLALDFEAQWLDAIRQVQSDAIVYDGITVYNMGDFGDFVNLPLIDQGAIVGAQPLPSFAAIGFSLKLNTRAVRPGSKRIAGIPETYTLGNVITNAAYIADIELLRLKFSASMVGAGDTWQPIVIKRVKTPVVGTVPLKYNYRLPEVDADLVYGNVVVAVTSNDISSQVSRKK